MHFRSTSITYLVFFAFLFQGCGLLGSKDEPNKVLVPQTNIGCLNGLGKKIGKYFKGRITAQEWDEIFICVDEQFVFFKKYVRGNASQGYTHEDIASLTRSFLITDRPVSTDFIQGIFELKASIFGGSAEVMTKKEIDDLIGFIQVLREESARVLPQIQAKVNAPTVENLKSQAEAIRVFGQNVSHSMSQFRGTHAVQKKELSMFVKELLALVEGDPAVVDQYQDFIFSLKVILAGGDTQEIEAQDWPILIQEGAAFGGLLFAFRDFPETTSTGAFLKGNFYVDLAEKALVEIAQIFDRHGGKISIEKIYPAIDHLPWGGLTKSKRLAIKQTLPKALYRMFQGKEFGFLDLQSFQRLFEVYREGVERQTHIEKIYQSTKSTLTLEEFKEEASLYLDRLETAKERNQVTELIRVAKAYIGLYPQGSNTVYFSSWMRGLRSENHMIRMQWYDLVAQYILSVYSSDQNYKLGTVQDLKNLTDDFIEVLTEWKLAHPQLTTQEMAIKRFREANLFTPASNGDSFMDPTETTYYLSYLFSSSKLASYVYRFITEGSQGCPIVGADELNEPAVEMDCFREVYFQNYKIFWSGFPALIQSYQNMNEEQKEKFRSSMEVAARQKTAISNRAGLYDAKSFSALPHYAENVIERFDVDGDQVLNKQEILKIAYPVFRETLVGLSGSNQDWLLQASLTYALKFGKIPKTKLEQAHLLTWAARRPFWKIRADRGAIYHVLALFSDPMGTQPIPSLFLCIHEEELSR